jgi:N-acetylglucosamine malate deacetylase 1
MKQFTRRALLRKTTLAAASAWVGLPLLSSDASSATSDTSRKLKVIVCGAHPDDPESGCGGTIARYSNLGHDVAMLYLTRGEAGIQGKSAQETAVIRTAECTKACAILRARPIFAGQIDGNTEVSPSRYDDFRKILQAEHPDIVFTHWPIDTHRDHRSTALLVYDAWVGSGRKFDLYYFEVDQGSQTQQFNPTTYVDISQTEGRKRAACFAHGSQQPEQGVLPTSREDAALSWHGKWVRTGRGIRTTLSRFRTFSSRTLRPQAMCPATKCVHGLGNLWYDGHNFIENSSPT